MKRTEKHWINIQSIILTLLRVTLRKLKSTKIKCSKEIGRTQIRSYNWMGYFGKQKKQYLPRNLLKTNLLEKKCILDKSSLKYYYKRLAVFAIIEYNMLSTLRKVYIFYFAKVNLWSC